MLCSGIMRRVYEIELGVGQSEIVRCRSTPKDDYLVICIVFIGILLYGRLRNAK